MSESANFVGLVAAVSLLPVAIAGPFFGTLVDRASIRKCFVAVSIGLLICPLLFVFLSVRASLEPASLLFLAGVFGIAVSAYHPVRQSIGPRLVDRPEIKAVVALSALNFNVGRVVSPVVGGLMISVVGETYTGFIAALLFLPNLAIIAQLAPREVTVQTGSGFFTELAEGVQAVMQKPMAMRALVFASFGLGPIRALTEILPILADGVFSMGVEGLGVLTSCIGAGALVASMVQVMGGQRLTQYRVLPWIILTVGYFGTALMVWAPNFYAVSIASSINGFASAFLAVWLQTALQSDLPDRLRGRVMSLWMVSVTLSTSILAFCVGWGAEIVGLPLAMLTVQGVGIFGLGSIFWYWRAK